MPEQADDAARQEQCHGDEHGAFFVNGAKSWFTQAFPEFWLYFLGALFIAVTLFLPNGIVGLLRRKKEPA